MAGTFGPYNLHSGAPFLRHFANLGQSRVPFKERQDIPLGISGVIDKR